MQLLTLSSFRKSRSFRIIGAVFAVLGIAYAVYSATLNTALPQLAKAKVRIKWQKSEIKSLTSHLEESKARLHVAEQEAAVMRRANQLIRQDESSRQAELNRLQGELDFYQRLASISGTQAGLAVYQLELNPTGSSRVFQFLLTLTQNLQRSGITSGIARIDVEGTLGDRPVTLPWARLTEGNKPAPEFRFKYFQQLDGYILLPEGFTPSQVRITLVAKGQSGKPVSRSFDWNALAEAAANSISATIQSNPDPGLEQEQPEEEIPDSR
jgi:hypothetical protein